MSYGRRYAASLTTPYGRFRLSRRRPGEGRAPPGGVQTSEEWMLGSLHYNCACVRLRAPADGPCAVASRWPPMVIHYYSPSSSRPQPPDTPVVFVQPCVGVRVGRLSRYLKGYLIWHTQLAVARSGVQESAWRWMDANKCVKIPPLPSEGGAFYRLGGILRSSSTRYLGQFPSPPSATQLRCPGRVAWGLETHATQTRTNEE